MAKAAANEGKKKKKGSMPMVVALVVMLGAGGVFGMKLGGGKKEAPKVELGEVVSLGEFLVNLSDGHTFLKVEVSVHVQKGQHLDEGGAGHSEGKAEPPAPVRDAVIGVLSSKALNEIATPSGKLELKKELAAAINAVVPREPEKDKKPDSDKVGGDSDKEKGSKPPKLVNPDWDSQTGPVLKVYFTNFATQT